ncbi:hypothetical protein KJ877_03580 [bacterium]|nr:hypothetical protein [bacterium]MBU1990590.1 hypothetical protein [bacterium]
MWLTKLKIAIIEKNTDALNKLLEDIPELSGANETQEAIYLLREAAELVHGLQDDTANSMKQIKKNLQFLRSTESRSSSKFDIRS